MYRSIACLQSDEFLSDKINCESLKKNCGKSVVASVGGASEGLAVSKFSCYFIWEQSKAFRNDSFGRTQLCLAIFPIKYSFNI